MFTARVNDLQSFVFATGHTIPNCKLPVGVEPTSLDYRSRPQPLRQGSINCELLLRLNGSIAARSKDILTFKLLSRIRQGSNLRWAFARQINSLLSSTSRPLIHNPYRRQRDMRASNSRPLAWQPTPPIPQNYGYKEPFARKGIIRMPF